MSLLCESMASICPVHSGVEIRYEGSECPLCAAEDLAGTYRSMLESFAEDQLARIANEIQFQIEHPELWDK